MTELQVGIFYFAALILGTTIVVYRWEIMARAVAVWQALIEVPSSTDARRILDEQARTDRVRPR
jgi:hypothetical protein